MNWTIASEKQLYIVDDARDQMGATESPLQTLGFESVGGKSIPREVQQKNSSKSYEKVELM